MLGVSVALNLVGSIPSLVASVRMISNKFFFSKTKSQYITKIFSENKLNNLRNILTEVAVNIFYTFESQFMQVTDKAGDKMAIEKLAEDAVNRLFNGILKLFDTYKLITKELIEKSILQGPSENFIDPNIKRVQLTIPGYALLSKKGIPINTAKLYERAGLVEFLPNGQARKFYALKNYPSNKYGYRRLLSWEKESNGELIKNLRSQYFEKEYFQVEKATQIISKNYHYSLEGALNTITAKTILNKIEQRNFPIAPKKIETKPSIYFDLRKPVKNFSGRITILEKLHSTLMSKMTIAIVPAWSSLSISPLSTSSDSQSSSPSSGSQLSITGLGGIGKTQLALRYAELYAEYYDHNVIWIDSETKENLAYSFNKLARKLNIKIKDPYGLDKSLEEIIEEIYEYFSDRKSLFIFDNVENYRALETYFPRPRLGNKPTVLITSRYTNWSNIAPVIALPVFTELETIEMIQKSLHLIHIRGSAMKELNQLLQGLPLALQQAIAYIKLRQHTNPNFSIKDYIKLFKIKAKELLNFNYFEYSNDSYLKTVFTTWLVTLDKIKTEKLGPNALAILNIMAYLYPDYIPKGKFYYLTRLYEKLELSDIDKILNLLISYSMINSKDEASYMIHRLTQQTLRINIESNPRLFQIVVSEAQELIWHWNNVYKHDSDTIFHHMHFSLYMSEHKELIDPIAHGDPEKNFFDSLTLQNLQYSQYFIDLAYLKFPKNKFLIFLGKGMAYYTKLGYFFHLNQLIVYLLSQWDKKNVSRENIKYMLEHIYQLKSRIFRLKRYSNIKTKQADQRSSVKLFYDFVSLVFGRRLDLYDACESHSQKRSLCLSEEERNKLNDFSNPRLKSHFEKVGKVSRYISSGLMTKDTFSALVQGHFDEVAINFGLITSSVFFGKIANTVFTQGKSLASEAHVLEKDLNLENKKVLQILWNEEILSAGKRQFLGKAMQVASPFIAKATSIFFAYNLKNEIYAYKQGHTEVLPSIVSNSVILGVDGVDAVITGAEFLEFIAGVSAFTGPLGEGITLAAWIGADTYSANQQLNEIEKYVHLSRGEAFFEFLLSFLHQEPLEYIQLKAENGQRVENTINFLKKNTAIQFYIFPSSAFSEDLYPTRKVFLDQKISFTLDESNPDQPREGNLFCLVASPPPEDPKNKNTSYVCHKALGVSYSLDRTGNATLINLGDGNDEVIAFSDTPNVFFLNNGKKSYVGGNSGNLFDLSGNAITGKLQGGSGEDILFLDNFYPENSDYLLLDTLGVLCGKNDSIQQVPPLCPDKRKIQINQIDQIHSRKNQADIIYLDHSISFIDGYGGKNRTYPDSFFITEHANKNLKFVLRNNTFITFSPVISTASVNYNIPANEEGNTWIHYYFEQPIQHRLFFEYSVQAIDTISIENNTLHISIVIQNQNDENKKTFAITFTDLLDTPTKQANIQLPLSQNIHYLFNDMELKLINNTTLYGKEIIANNETIDEKIELFSALANRLEKAFSIQVINNKTLSIGRENKPEIFYLNSAYENHLINNGGENVYVILANNNTVFPLPNITLYDSDGIDPDELIERIDSLDLREMVKKYKEIYPNAVIASHVFPENDDLILTLTNAVYTPFHDDPYNLNCFLPWLTIRLKNALFNDTNWYQRLDIFLDASPQSITAIDNEFWTLAKAPILFTSGKNIILLTHQDIEEETQFEILKNIGDFAFFRDETDLILTNAFTPSIDYCTIICSQFYTDEKMKKKTLSSTFKFFDRTIHPKNYQQKIDQASHFQHLTQLFLTNVSDSKVRSYLNSLDIIPANDDQEKLLPTVRRRKRQINHLPQSSSTSEDDRIFAIADDYLSKYDHARSKNKVYSRKKNNNPKSLKKENLNASNAIQESHTPKKHDQLAHSKNNANYSKHRKSNYFSQNNLDQAQKLTEKKYPLRVNSNLIQPNKTNFFKDTNLIKKQTTFIPKNALPYHENNKFNAKTSSMISQLTYKNNHSNSKKSNGHPSTSYTEQPNVHNTLVFMDFIAKAINGRPKPLSYDKKRNKNINKAQKIKENVNADVFGLNKYKR